MEKREEERQTFHRMGNGKQANICIWRYWPPCAIRKMQIKTRARPSYQSRTLHSDEEQWKPLHMKTDQAPVHLWTVIPVLQTDLREETLPHVSWENSTQNIDSNVVRKKQKEEVNHPNAEWMDIYFIITIINFLKGIIYIYIDRWIHPIHLYTSLYISYFKTKGIKTQSQKAVDRPSKTKSKNWHPGLAGWTGSA